MGYEEQDSLFHCFLCNDLAKELVKQGIKFNSHGLIPSFEQAKRAADYVTELGQQEEVEASFYLPWLILKYS